MNKSESIKELAVALAKFQGEVSNPINNAINPHFHNKYATLSEVLNVVRPILSKHGLSMVQEPSGDGENIIITTTLFHNSGEYIEFEKLILKADKPTAQGAGSAITYGRRYAISAILGISSEDDDDGNQATDKVDDKKELIKPTNKFISEPQIKRLFTIAHTVNIDGSTVKAQVKAKLNKEVEDLTKAEYDAVCKGYEGLKK